MFTARFTMIAAALALAAGVSVSLLQAAAPGGAPAATTPAKVGSVSGKVVDKDGKAAVGAQVRVAAATAPAPAGGAGGARGARGGRGPTTMTDDKGAFTVTAVPVGSVNVSANMTAADGTRQTGTTATPVDVKEGVETKLTADIKLADAPARGAGGARGARGGAASAPAAGN